MKEETHYHWTEQGILNTISYANNTTECYTINALDQLLDLDLNRRTWLQVSSYKRTRQYY